MNTKKQIIKKCDWMANKFLELATDFKSLSKSLERTTDKKEITLIKGIIKFSAEKLEEYFNKVKGGLKE